jgi:16S rRNA (guanine966-N2)-methyltransferase
MRIIAGALGGRQLQPPPGHRSHPMGDKVRGALFAALGDIDGLELLDAYSGSGALALEAASRGAARVLAIDNDRRAVSTITENVRSLGMQDVVAVTQAPVFSWSQNNPEVLFDIVLADPPYDDLHPAHVVELSRHVRPGGVLVLSWPSDITPPDLPRLKVVRDKSYAQARILFYRMPGD